MFVLILVPAAFDYDSHTQQQADRWKRPELNYGCVEFVAPTEYMVRPPQAPAFVFILDVSYSAVQSGMLATATRTLMDTLDRLPNEENRTNIAIITVDSALHFYNFGDGLEEPQMLVVADLEDVFLPQPTGLFANLTRNMEGIKSLMEKLPDMFKDTVNVNNALGPGLQAAFKMLVKGKRSMVYVSKIWILIYLFLCLLIYSLPMAAKSFAYNLRFLIPATVLSNLVKM